MDDSTILICLPDFEAEETRAEAIASAEKNGEKVSLPATPLHHFLQNP